MLFIGFTETTEWRDPLMLLFKCIVPGVWECKSMTRIAYKSVEYGFNVLLILFWYLGFLSSYKIPPVICVRQTQQTDVGSCSHVSQQCISCVVWNEQGRIWKLECRKTDNSGLLKADFFPKSFFPRFSSAHSLVSISRSWLLDCKEILRTFFSSCTTGVLK